MVRSKRRAARQQGICLLGLLVLATPSLVTAATTFDETKITASDALERLAFGVGTAIGPRIAVVGSFGASQPFGPGAAHIFLDVSPAGDWSDLVERKVSASDGANEDFFGFNIAVEERTIVVAAEGLNAYSGAVYVYQDTSVAGDWSSVSETKIVSSDLAVGDGFGSSVEIDGSILAVGAQDDDDNGSSSGSVYLFRDTSAPGDWSTFEETKILPSDGAAVDAYGISIDIKGRALLVGASAAGKAYLMRDTSADNSWSSIVETIFDPPGSDSGFGISAALAGSVAAVGCPGSKSVHLFLDTSGDGSWVSYDEVVIRPFDHALFGQVFGITMSFSEDLLVVGAPADEQVATQAGAVYVYQDASQDSDWSSYLETKVLEPAPAESNQFGLGISVHNTTWIAGAIGNDDAGSDTGAAYVFSNPLVFTDGFESGDTLTWSSSVP